MPIITLTTDFGTDSPYVAAMRGVIKSINPDAEIIDITHAVRPQDVRHGAIVLADITPYFPEGSIHVAVVDPGVGTDRRIVAAEIDSRFYILPDNGLLTLLVQQNHPSRIVQLDRREFWRKNISSTFHGRDIMAPAAAHLSTGRINFNDLGSQLDIADLTELRLPSPQIIEEQNISGEIIDIDSFGNLITNITETVLHDAGILRETYPNVTTITQSFQIPGISQTYGNSPSGTLITLVGSSARLEIALVNGSAQKEIAATIGDSVRIHIP